MGEKDVVAAEKYGGPLLPRCKMTHFEGEQISSNEYWDTAYVFGNCVAAIRSPFSDRLPTVCVVFGYGLLFGLLKGNTILQGRATT